MKNIEKIFEENKRKQLELIEKISPFHSKKKYKNQADLLVNKAYGFKNSYENCTSVDGNDDPIPWMTYPSIFYFSQFDLSSCDIFEWGSGNSTHFFSRRAKTVTTIESNRDWYNYILREKPENVDLNLVGADDYASIIKNKSKKYHVISIDGDIFRRFECAYYAVDFLNDGGMIILDNSDWLENTTAFIRSKGFIQVDFSGMVPINDVMSCTSVFLSRDFNLKGFAKQPGFVKCGYKNVRD